MKDMISELLEIGLTEYEAKAYLVLLKQNVVGATEITKISNITRGRIYDILNLLIEKGFCITVPGTIKKFQAVDPKVAMHNLIELQKKKEQRMKETTAKLHELYINQVDTSSPLDYIHVLTSKASMIKKFHELDDKAKKIIRTFNKGPYIEVLDPASIMDRSAFLEESLKKGKIEKALYEIDKDNIDELIKELKYFIDPREEIRLCDHLPMKMKISDNKAVMISLRNNGNPKSKLTAMIVEHSDLTDALIELFDIYWEKAIPLDEFIKNQKKKKP